MEFRKVIVDNKSDVEFIERLYIESFPRHERRPVLEMHRLMKDETRFHVFLLESDEKKKIGFITYWKFDSFIFLDHFAISPEHRNEGNGQKAIHELVKETTLPLVGEVELPATSDLAERRVKFYKKQGFQVWNLPYEQPPYEEGFQPVPMLVITYRT